MFDTSIPNCMIVDPAKASDHGFNIEGPMAFVFDMGCALGCLGYSTLNKTWQFDVTPNDEGEVYQFTDSEIRNALVRASHLTEMVRKVVEYKGTQQGEIDHTAFLENFA